MGYASVASGQPWETSASAPQGASASARWLFASAPVGGATTSWPSHSAWEVSAAGGRGQGASAGPTAPAGDAPDHPAASSVGGGVPTSAIAGEGRATWDGVSVIVSRVHHRASPSKASSKSEGGLSFVHTAVPHSTPMVAEVDGEGEEEEEGGSEGLREGDRGEGDSGGASPADQAHAGYAGQHPSATCIPLINKLPLLNSSRESSCGGGVSRGNDSSASGGSGVGTNAQQLVPAVQLEVGLAELQAALATGRPVKLHLAMAEQLMAWAGRRSHAGAALISLQPHFLSYMFWGKSSALTTP